MPIRTDLFSSIMLLGIAQGLFLCYFFLSRKPHIFSNAFLGLLMGSFSLLMLEVFLCYTNMMFYTLPLVDFSEPCNFLLTPLTYLYLYTKIHSRFEKRQYVHFAMPLLYLAYEAIVFFPQSLAHKYNSYIGAYHPQLTRMPADVYWGNEVAFFLKNHVNDLTLLQFLVYLFLIYRLLWMAFRSAQLPFFSKENPTLAWCRNVALQMLLMVCLFVVVKLSFEDDLGDHILVAHLALVIYLISFQVMRQSVFVQQEENKKKYEKSTLTPDLEAQALMRMQEVIATQKPHLQADFSLPGFAKMLRLTPHQLSQILNERLGKSFFEYAAQHRIEAAQQLLKDNPDLKIEEIAERVGYSSKSSFNTSFKKIVGITPSEFRKEAGKSSI